MLMLHLDQWMEQDLLKRHIPGMDVARDAVLERMLVIKVVVQLLEKISNLNIFSNFGQKSIGLVHLTILNGRILDLEELIEDSEDASHGVLL